MIKILHKFFITCIAGVFAFLILNLLTCFYSWIQPLEINESMATGLRYRPNSWYSFATEGYSYGKFDKDGFNNAYVSKTDQVDYLIMGSSQVEAIEVMPDQNFTYILNELLDSNKYVYNIGRSGQFLPECVYHVKKANERYRPKQAIVIETGALDFAQKDIDEALEECVIHGPVYGNASGINWVLRRLPFVSLVHTQISLMLNKSENGDALSTEQDFDDTLYRKKIEPLLKKIKNDTKDTPVIILYHPGMRLMGSGAMELVEDESMLDCFEKLCNENSIYFLDMSDRFVEEYKRNYAIPYGFTNSAIAKGHLNKKGHRMIAEELYSFLGELD